MNQRVICAARCDGWNDVANLRPNDYHALGQVQQDRILAFLNKIVIAEGRGRGWLSYSNCKDVLFFGMFFYFLGRLLWPLFSVHSESRRQI